jgi:outer membrane protein assembly factor BamE (lipoprotein component of BamABCDE complex)
MTSRKMLLVMLAGIILAIVAGLVYRHIKIEGYNSVRNGMTAEEVAAKIGEPSLKTNQMGMDIWFYGLRNKQRHSGALGSPQYSFNAEFAVIFDPGNHRVMAVDQSTDKEWLVSLSTTHSN